MVLDLWPLQLSRKKIFFWQGVKWITHLSLAISDRSCCIFWLTRGDFSLPGLAMPNRPWFVAGKDRGCVGQAVHLVALSPSSHKPSKGCNSQILHQGTGRGRLRAKNNYFWASKSKMPLASHANLQDRHPTREKWVVLYHTGTKPWSWKSKPTLTPNSKLFPCLYL